MKSLLLKRLALFVVLAIVLFSWCSIGLAKNLYVQGLPGEGTLGYSLGVAMTIYP